MKKSLFTLLALVFASQAFAQTWVGFTKIKYLYPNSNAFTFIIEEKHPELSSCDHGGRFHVPMDHPNYDALVSTLMMAFAADKEIYINVNSHFYDGPVCDPSINRVMVR